MSAAETRILADRYALVQRLGEGPHGTVYEAENLLVGSRVAVKVLARGSEHLVDQARVCARLDHPNIARVLDLGGSPPTPYIVREKVDGVPLSRGALSPSQPRAAADWRLAVDVALQLLSALETAHERRLIHGALHPENVLVRFPRPGVPWVLVTDFAGPHPGIGPSARSRAFLAPEVADGSPASPRSDLYSVAALLQHVLAGSLTPGAQRPPDALSALLRRGLSRSPEDRPANATEFAEELGETLNAGLVPTPAPWSIAPNIVYVNSVPGAARDDGDAPEAPADSSLGSLPVAGIAPAPRDSRVTDSLLRNPQFQPHAKGAAPEAPPSEPPARPHWWWASLALVLVLPFLAVLARLLLDP